MKKVLISPIMLISYVYFVIVIFGMKPNILNMLNMFFIKFVKIPNISCKHYAGNIQLVVNSMEGATN